MRGFDPRWQDLPDYILGITKEIWEERQVASLRRTYAADLPLRSPAGNLVGNEAVINATLATLAEFPDRQLLGEDVIWSGDEDTGFLSSHRLMSVGTHLGHGQFGAPTGRRFQARAIADCAVRNNQVYDEWLCRDTAKIALDLGWDAKAYAREIVAREGGAQAATQRIQDNQDPEPVYTGRGNDNPWGQKLADTLKRIMNADFAVISGTYDRAAFIAHPGGREGWSHGFAEAAWMGLRSSFPSATFSIEHCIGREDPLSPPRAAIRWSLKGRHDGPGLFGQPTGAELAIMGFTQAEFGPWGLRREFTLFDEIAILKHIILHTGEAE